MKILEKYRECVLHIKTLATEFLKQSEQFSCLPFLGLTLFPVLISGCSPSRHDIDGGQETTTPCFIRLDTDGKSASDISSLDFFVFNDDDDARLDAYQRNEEIDGAWTEVSSRHGDKIINVVANSARDRYGWSEINSRKTLERMCADLEDERRSHPLMSGSEKVSSPENGMTSIRLYPLASEIVLRSLKCDFSGKPYKGALLEDIRVYLTDINAVCPIWAEEPVMPQRVVNCGGFSETDASLFTERDLIIQDFRAAVGEKSVNTDIRLRCFPNNSITDTPGSPFTCLVIEGRIGEETWYWPIEVNRGEEDGNGTGVERNRIYTYDVVIKGKGSPSADIPVSKNEVGTSIKVKEWKHMEEYSVSF